MKAFFYFNTQDEHNNPLWLLIDSEYCAKSENTIDIKFNDFVLNAHILQMPHMFYFEGRKGLMWDRYTDKERIENQIGYLASFKHVSDDYDAMREKLSTNPTLRLLISNKELKERVFKIAGELNLTQ